MPCVVTLPKANIRLLVIFKILIEMRWWGAESGGVIFAPLESQGVERNIDSWERSFITCFGFLNFKTFPQISWLLTLMTAWCKSLYLDTSAYIQSKTFHIPVFLTESVTIILGRTIVCCMTGCLASPAFVCLISVASPIIIIRREA